MTEGLEGRTLGSFQLEERLGSGAFATVYRAHQTRLGRHVAVKVLDRELARDPNAARRFEREGRSAASLDHPAIVPVYGAGEEGGIVFLAMRLVAGETLAARLEAGPLDSEELVRIVGAVAGALDHAHSRGVIHRDVKPSNILLEGERVYLADFGIAATAREVGRYTAGAIGTASYMAPEQARAGEIDHRADLYSLGCVVFECLTGAPPYFRADMIELLLAHVHDPIPDTGNPGRDAFFARALAKDREERFESGAALAEALARAVRGEAAVDTLPARGVAVATAPMDVAPPTEEADLADDHPWRRRRRPVAAAVVVALVAVVLVLTQGRGNDDGADPVAVAEGGAVSFGIQGRWDTLNPHQDLDMEGLISGHVLPPLFMVADDGTPTPHLAAALPTLESESPQIVSWTIRPDAVWDDGSPVTATDVEATYRYVIDPASGATSPVLYERIGAFEVTGERSFRITFREPVAPYWTLFNSLHPVIKADALDRHVAEGGSLGDFLVDGIDFSGGPFRVAGYTPGESIRLTRNPRWWGEERPHLDRVEGRVFSTADELAEATALGDIDVAIMVQPQPSNVRAIRELEGKQVQVEPGRFAFGLLFNHRGGPTADPVVRRAIAHAIDRSALVDTTLGRLTSDPPDPLQSLVFSPEQPAYEPHFDVYDYDPARAEELLTEAGWVPGPDGVRAKDGTRLAINYRFAGSGESQIVAQQLLDQFEDVGIAATAEGFPSVSTFNDAIASGDFQIAAKLWLFNTDPLHAAFLYGGDQCPSTVPGCTGPPAAFNFGGYADEEVDARFAGAATTFDVDRRARLFNDADAAMVSDLPALPLYVSLEALAAADGLVNVEFRSLRGGPLGGLADWGRRP